MAKDTVTLALAGKPTLGELATAVVSFSTLIDRLSTKCKATGVQWLIADLEHGSALATARGTPVDPGDYWHVERVVEAYHAVGQSVKDGRVWHLWDRKIAEPAAKITSVIHGDVPSVRFETPDSDVEIFAPAATRKVGSGSPLLEAKASELSIGSIIGRVQTLTNRGALRFTMYDLSADKPVSCYLPAGADSESMMRDLWGQVVIVDGTIRRSPLDDSATTVRAITGIQRYPVNDPEKYDFREARGVLKLTRTNEMPEEAIRRVRRLKAMG